MSQQGKYCHPVTKRALALPGTQVSPTQPAQSDGIMAAVGAVEVDTPSRLSHTTSAERPRDSISLSTPAAPLARQSCYPLPGQHNLGDKPQRKRSSDLLYYSPSLKTTLRSLC